MSDQPLWSPKTGDATRLAQFIGQVEAARGKTFSGFDDLHRWSVDSPHEFWRAVWDFCGVIGEPGDTVLADDAMPGARWFPAARLNFAENLLRDADGREAIVWRSENGAQSRLTRRALYVEVSCLAQALRAQGVRAGDRVAAYMPNLPATVVVMLACASIGAIFSSASPDFGVQGVIDRFGQIAPKVLFVVDAYHYNGKRIDMAPRLAEIFERLESVERMVVAGYDGGIPAPIADAMSWQDFMVGTDPDWPLECAPLPFDHPLYILYSSGTTGVPKCITHGAGGTLLQHLKEHQLHSDIRAGDRVFYFTTCGWMMWNWLASALATQATICLFDGSPAGAVLFDYAQDERFTHFGTSAKFIDACAKAGLQPAQTHDLSALRVLLSTGSPLVPEGFDYVYQHIKRDLQLASISGGTDIISCFVLGNPMAPVWRGEIQAKGLGMAVEVFDDEGRPVSGEKGELVCTRPAPSMPIGFWNDPDGAKYRAAYFERFPGVWCHGDFCEITEHGGFVIYGRSDATLNPGGVRIGTAEIYRQVEKLGEVMESLVIGQNWPPGSIGDLRVVLFVKLREGLALDEALILKIRHTIRDNTTPRHVPAKVVQVLDIPRTKSGKIVELAVRNVVHGLPVKNLEALANPEALNGFRDRAELGD